MAASIPLHLSDADDGDSDKKIIGALQDLVDGIESSASVARTIHEIIVIECRDACTTMPNSNLGQPKDGTYPESTPDGWMKFLWDCLGKAAMRVPANHNGQDELIRLLKELQQLPKTSVAWLVRGERTEKVLWNLTKETGYGGFVQWLWELNQSNLAGLVYQEERDPGVSAAYSNFSAFLARLLASGIVDTNQLSALIAPSPFAKRSPYVIEQDVRYYEPYASAAAQWVLYAGNALHTMCEQRILVEIGKQRYNQALWRSWKAKFEVFAKNDSCMTEVHDLARQAIGTMSQLEKDGCDPMKNIIEKFGYLRPLEGED